MPPAETTEQGWIKSDSPCTVYGNDDRIESKIWFKSKPIDRSFCYRVTQLQLCTDSKDQGWVSDGTQGSWSWFEIVILPDKQATKPRTSEDGKELVWRSHHNRLATQKTTAHFGMVFDRRSELLTYLQVCFHFDAS
jgi:hypothetical protein